MLDFNTSDSFVPDPEEGACGQEFGTTKTITGSGGAENSEQIEDPGQVRNTTDSGEAENSTESGQVDNPTDSVPMLLMSWVMTVMMLALALMLRA